MWPYCNQEQTLRCVTLCKCDQSTSRRRGMAVASVCSLLAGLIFGLGWLLWIDAHAYAATNYGQTPDGTYWIPGILQTIGLLMLNVITWEAVADSDSLMEDRSASIAKLWVFVAFCFSFGGILGSIWILVKENHDPSWEAGSVAAAVKLLLMNLMIFFSSLMFRLSRTKSDA